MVTSSLTTAMCPLVTPPLLLSVIQIVPLMPMMVIPEETGSHQMGIGLLVLRDSYKEGLVRQYNCEGALLPHLLGYITV